LFLRHFQPFPSPDAFDPVLAYLPSLVSQHGGDPPIAVASVLASEYGRYGVSFQSRTSAAWALRYGFLRQVSEGRR